MDKQGEMYVLRKLQSMASEVNKIRDIGKQVISSLYQHIIEKHKGYLITKDKKDLQVTLEFFGIQVLVKAEILLTPSFQEDVPASSPTGDIVAYLSPEKEEDEPEKLSSSFKFDELGNIKQSLQIDSFPIYFIKHLIDELLKKGRPIS